MGWGIQIHVEQVHQETESTGFGASGEVVTADGRRLGFDLQLSMRRELTQTSTADIRLGDAARTVDPLGLSISGGPVELSSDRSSFDLDGDGAPEQVALPASGTYFLALDRNGNGTIDDGHELFGPATGDGFAELARLDEDGNGWIDEGDAGYARLRLWSGQGPATETRTLAEAGIGALFTGSNVATAFSIRGDGGEALGEVRASSVYLAEDGRAGAVQQVDLTA